jgi:uncharacterized protein YbjT (DUF2867 family)
MTTILVTGATGTIGGQVVKALRGAAGVTVRAAVRRVDQAQGLAGDNVTPVEFDYGDAGSIAKAVDGADALFVLLPISDAQVELGARLVAAAKSSVKRVVKLSAIGCEIEPGIQFGRWHRAVEKQIEASGIAWTFLRANNFFENFVNFYPPDAQGNIYLPWGDGACSFVAGGDVAAVAKVALTTPGHEGRAYTVTGPEAITIAQAARAISEVTGRAIAYVDVPEAAAEQGMRSAGMPAWMVSAMKELHAIDKAGYAAAVSDDVERVTGRKATTFLAFARASAARWKL